MKIIREKNIKKVIFEYFKIIIISFILSGIIMCFVRTTKVSGISMKNTLQDDDILLFNAMSYKISSPEYRDIVVIDTFREKNKFIIKRVIAVAGDTFEIKDNKILLNNVELQEDYIKSDEVFNYENFDKIVIPDGKIFVMGDNRKDSADSRVFGLFNWKDQVIGEIIVGLIPFKNAKDLYIDNI